MTDTVAAQASLEAILKDEIINMYQEVAENPEGEFHFYHGRPAAEMFGYRADWLGRAPAASVASFAGVGNPHERSEMQPGETVLDLGSGAGLDAIISSWAVGPSGKVIGIDLNPAMCLKAQAHAAQSGTTMECHEARMEDIPQPDATVDVIISNCVINLSPDKDAVFGESFRVLRPGGRMRVSDIVWTRKPTEAEQNDLASWAGCIAGALQVEEYVSKLEAAGFTNVTTRLEGDPDKKGWASAYINAERPNACC